MGSRYGRRIRRLVDNADKKRKAFYECPKGNKDQVKRKCYAIWQCRSCKSTFAGGAYSLTTSPGESAKRLIKK